MRSQGFKQLSQIVSSVFGKVNPFGNVETMSDKFQRHGSVVLESRRWPSKRSLAFIFNPSDIETILRKQGKCPYRPSNEFEILYRSRDPDRYPSVGFGNLQGEEWLKQRTIVAPVLLSNGVVRAYLPHSNSIASDFVAYLRHEASSSGQIEDLISCTNRYSLESIAMICLNSRLGCLSIDSLTEDGVALIKATKQLFEAYQVLYHGPPWWKHLPTPSFKKFCSAEDAIYEIASKYVNRAVIELEKLGSSARSTLNIIKPRYESDDGKLSLTENDDDGDNIDNQSGDDEDEEEVECLLNTLLKTQGLDNKQVRMLMIDFIAGGLNTVSTTLCLLLYHLAANPAVQDKLYSELRRTIVDSDEFISESTLAKLSYLKACLKETFRLTSVIHNLVRILPEPITLSGQTIPSGVPIMLCFGVACKNPDYFENPEEFQPERWLGQSRRKIHPFSLLPFGFGNRMCAGRRISEIELYLATIKTILNYQLIAETKGVNLRQDFIFVPDRPIKLRLIDRP